MLLDPRTAFTWCDNMNAIHQSCFSCIMMCDEPTVWQTGLWYDRPDQCGIHPQSKVSFRVRFEMQSAMQNKSLMRSRPTLAARRPGEQTRSTHTRHALRSFVHIFAYIKLLKCRSASGISFVGLIPDLPPLCTARAFVVKPVAALDPTVIVSAADE